MPGPLFDRGDVVHCFSPHADNQKESRHYAVIVGDPVANTRGDYILVQITSTSYNGRTDYTIRDNDPEFSQTGLAHTSTIRCHKIFVLAQSRVRRRVGTVGPNTLSAIEARVKIALAF